MCKKNILYSVSLTESVDYMWLETNVTHCVYFLQAVCNFTRSVKFHTKCEISGPQKVLTKRWQIWGVLKLIFQGKLPRSQLHPIGHFGWPLILWMVSLIFDLLETNGPMTNDEYPGIQIFIRIIFVYFLIQI